LNVPALRPVNDPVPVIVPVPPVAVTVTAPVVPPLHNTLVTADEVLIADGSLTLPEVAAVHPFASVTV
jgi:hypothetical protein